MKIIKYFLQFIMIMILFIIFKILGYKKSSDFGAYIFSKFGYLLDLKILNQNLQNIDLTKTNYNYENIVNNIWANYGRIFADYISIKNLEIII